MGKGTDGNRRNNTQRYEQKVLSRYRAMIAGIGWRDVKATDIDEAYKIVCKEYGCTVDDVHAMACLERM